MWSYLRHPAYAKLNLAAKASSQVWTWDITKLMGPAEWNYDYRYAILDTDSRCVLRTWYVRRVHGDDWLSCWAWRA